MELLQKRFLTHTQLQPKTKVEGEKGKREGVDRESMTPLIPDDIVTKLMDKPGG